jgi:hypothetical protein
VRGLPLTIVHLDDLLLRVKPSDRRVAREGGRGKRRLAVIALTLSRACTRRSDNSLLFDERVVDADLAELVLNDSWEAGGDGRHVDGREGGGSEKDTPAAGPPGDRTVPSPGGPRTAAPALVEITAGGAVAQRVC